MTPELLARLRPHGLDRVASEAGLDVVRTALLERGWSARNVERLLHVAPAIAPAAVPLAPREPPREAPNPAAAQPVHLRVLPVEDVRALEEHFRCEPYHATISARACVARQTGSQRSWNEVRAATGSRAIEHRGVGLHFTRCTRCPVGKRIADAVKA